MLTNTAPIQSDRPLGSVVLEGELEPSSEPDPGSPPKKLPLLVEVTLDDELFVGEVPLETPFGPTGTISRGLDVPNVELIAGNNCWS